MAHFSGCLRFSVARRTEIVKMRQNELVSSSPTGGTRSTWAFHWRRGEIWKWARSHLVSLQGNSCCDGPLLHNFHELIRPRTFGGPPCRHLSTRPRHCVGSSRQHIWAFLLVLLPGDGCLISVPVHLCRPWRLMTQTVAVNEQPRISSGHASRDVPGADGFI